MHWIVWILIAGLIGSIRLVILAIMGCGAIDDEIHGRK